MNRWETIDGEDSAVGFTHTNPTCLGELAMFGHVPDQNAT
jgi:hypothetical protein